MARVSLAELRKRLVIVTVTGGMLIAAAVLVVVTPGLQDEWRADGPVLRGHRALVTGTRARLRLLAQIAGTLVVALQLTLHGGGPGPARWATLVLLFLATLLLVRAREGRASAVDGNALDLVQRRSRWMEEMDAHLEAAAEDGVPLWRRMLMAVDLYGRGLALLVADRAIWQLLVTLAGPGV